MKLTLVSVRDRLIKNPFYRLGSSAARIPSYG